ncbi:GntR family transcriptional regulator [bacterium]|nr:GntR family transcriptional regulator [bacterium]
MIASKKKDIIYQSIRRAIVTLELEPGDIFNEADLSKQHNVSKTPVREALIMLAHEGFVEAIPRIGYRVTSVSMQDVLEAFHLRILLEVEAAGLAANRISDDEITTLKENVYRESQFSQESINYDTYWKLHKLNQEFHYSLAMASRNSRLANLIKQLIDEMERVLSFDPNLRNDFKDHNTIVDALEQRNKTKAEKAMKKHIEATRTRILDRF